MTARRTDISDLPHWPRGLSLAQAAAYVGVSVPTFLTEIDLGRWPPGQRRGAKGSRVVWDRKALDRYYDRASRLGELGPTEDEALRRLE